MPDKTLQQRLREQDWPEAADRIDELEGALTKCGNDARAVIADALRLKESAEARCANLEAALRTMLLEKP